MKHGKQSLLISALLVISVFAIMTCANAGGVFKRGGDGDKDRDTNQSNSQNRQDNNSTATSSDDKSKSDNRSNQQQSDNQANHRQSNNQGNRQQSGNQSNQQRSDNQGDRQKTDNKDDQRTKHNERPDAPSNSSTRTPGGTYQGNVVGDQRPYNRRNQDPVPYTGKVITPRSSAPTSEQGRWMSRSKDWNDKYLRTSGRAKPYYEHPSSVSTPRQSNGYYYYGQGRGRHEEYPHSYGHWVFSATIGSRPSIYFHYGYLPYVPLSRVITLSRPRVRYVEVPIMVDVWSRSTDYYLDNRQYSGLGASLADIKSAWIDQYPDRLLAHVPVNSRVNVMLDGNYSYTVDATDYRNMTNDAINTTETISFQFDTVLRRDDGRVIAYATHEYYNTDGDRKTVYVSYLIEQHGRRWDIVEVGSSLRRLDR